MLDLIFSLTLAGLSFAGISRIAAAHDDFWRNNCATHYERNYEWQTISFPG